MLSAPDLRWERESARPVTEQGALSQLQSAAIVTTTPNMKPKEDAGERKKRRVFAGRSNGGLHWMKKKDLNYRCHRKKRELMKTPSLSKKSRAGSPAPQSEAQRKDVLESSTEGSGNPAVSSPLPSGTLKRPTSLSRHASAAGIPLSSPRSKSSKPGGAPSPPESGEGPFIEVEDISQLLGDVARFAERLEKLRDVVLTDGKYYCG
ncbi:unnamed protein product [Ranitomeya imitator]|uniref:Uncharacterized protein n=1 Tax=Ranitomeya imitator TaxID=111125 RepID=A0ABN9L2J9_9NEOB|nr:unnamed protein product [Ranitomeya imitator]